MIFQKLLIFVVWNWCKFSSWKVIADKEYCLIQLTANHFSKILHENNSEMHRVFDVLCSFCVWHVFNLKHTQIKFKISVFPLGNESQIPQIEYSKTTNGAASLVAAISKK